MISILGFYRRSNDATEYIHFQDDGKEYLTNGVMIWDQEIKEKIDRLEKTETIDIGRMKGWLHTSRPYSNIAKYYGALTFEEFCQHIRDHIKRYFPEDSGYEKSDVSLMKVNKLNNKPLTALVIKKSDEVAVPSIYLNQYFAEYEEGKKDVHEIFYDIVEQRRKYEEEKNILLPDESVEELLSFERVKDRIIIKPVGYERNKDKLEGKMPFYVMGDIAATYHILLSSGDDFLMTAVINNELMGRYNITLQELHSLAIKNTMRAFPYKFMPMLQVMSEMTGIAFSKDDIPLYVLSNRKYNNGAATAFYPGIMDQIAKEFSGGFFVIPSSIHEMLILPKDGIERDDIRHLLRSVNVEMVAEEEILSDQIHEYDPVSKELYISGSELPSKMRDTKEHQKEQKQGKMR